MASDRQIAANRRNAKRSSGPKTAAGKKRVSRNASRHGLSSAMPGNSEEANRIRELADALGGDTSDPLIAERAIALAQAKRMLERVAQANMEMIKRVYAQGCVDKPPPHLFSKIEIFDDRSVCTHRPGVRVPKSLKVHPRLPADEPRRTTQAISRSLPVLTDLARYQRRAAVLFDRAFRSFMGICPLPSPDKSGPASRKRPAEGQISSGKKLRR